jgi:hypothetical protein
MQPLLVLKFKKKKRGKINKEEHFSLSLSSALSEGQGRERNDNEESIILEYHGHLGLDTRVGVAGCAGSGTGSCTGCHK